MTKLTDTQLIVLSSATKHDEGLATRPVSLNAAAATRSWMSAAVSSSLSPRKRATKKIEVMTAHLLPGEATRAALGVCKRVRRGDGIGPKLTDRLSNPRLDFSDGFSRAGGVYAAVSGCDELEGSEREKSKSGGPQREPTRKAAAVDSSKLPRDRGLSIRKKQGNIIEI
jgi:hypothetical protein